MSILNSRKEISKCSYCALYCAALGGGYTTAGLIQTFDENNANEDRYQKELDRISRDSSMDQRDKLLAEKRAKEQYTKDKIILAATANLMTIADLGVAVTCAILILGTI